MVVARDVVVHGQGVQGPHGDLQRRLRHLRQRQRRHAGGRRLGGGGQLPHPHPQLRPGAQGGVVGRRRLLLLLLFMHPQPAAVRVVGVQGLIGGRLRLLLEVHDQALVAALLVLQPLVVLLQQLPVLQEQALPVVVAPLLSGRGRSGPPGRVAAL